jgi:hypothetical protein
MVGNLEYIKQTNEGTIPGECLFFGCNESGGLGPYRANHEDREDHCFGYVDKDEPDPEIRKRWYGTIR